MLQTFKAILKGNSIEWIDAAPQFGNRSISVQITVIEDDISSVATRSQKIAEVLEKLAANRAASNIDPAMWEREVRQDRSLPGRDE